MAPSWREADRLCSCAFQMAIFFDGNGDFAEYKFSLAMGRPQTIDVDRSSAGPFVIAEVFQGTRTVVRAS